MFSKLLAWLSAFLPVVKTKYEYVSNATWNEVVKHARLPKHSEAETVKLLRAEMLASMPMRLELLADFTRQPDEKKARKIMDLAWEDMHVRLALWRCTNESTTPPITHLSQGYRGLTDMLDAYLLCTRVNDSVIWHYLNINTWAKEKRESLYDGIKLDIDTYGDSLGWFVPYKQ